MGNHGKKNYFVYFCINSTLHGELWSRKKYLLDHREFHYRPCHWCRTYTSADLSQPGWSEREISQISGEYFYLRYTTQLLDWSPDVLHYLKLVLKLLRLGLDVLEGHVDDGHHHVDQDHVHDDWNINECLCSLEVWDLNTTERSFI